MKCLLPSTTTVCLYVYELDMLVLANLDVHHCNESSMCTSTQNDEHKARVPTDYYFLGKHVCKGIFVFVHNIGPNKFKNFVVHFEKHGLVPQRHGNTE